MSDDDFEIVNSENIEKNIYKLSNVDIEYLKHYLKQQSQSLIDLTNIQKTYQEETTLDFSLEKIFMQNSQPLVDIYQYHHHYRHHNPYVKEVHEEPLSPPSFNNYNTFSLEIATCGMPKNTKLPVPYDNFSLTDGCFGDDAGFTTQLAQESFLGRFNN
jgi:hypothetical protein